jgi:hypothetical protein
MPTVNPSLGSLREHIRSAPVRRANATAVYVAFVLAACAALSPATAAADRSLAAGRSCAKLTGHRLKSGSRIKVVVKTSEEKGVAYACLVPNGRVRKVAAVSSEEDEVNLPITLTQVSGNWIALRMSSGLGLVAGFVDRAVNVATGRSFGLWSTTIGPGVAGEPPQKLVASVKLNSFGQVALAISEEDQPPVSPKLANTLIYGVEPTGERRLLDSGTSAQIPTGSLSLSGHKVQWQNAGVVRTATL